MSMDEHQASAQYLRAVLVEDSVPLRRNRARGVWIRAHLDVSDDEAATPPVSCRALCFDR